MLWTKKPSSRSSRKGVVYRVLSLLGRVLRTCVLAIVKALSLLGRALLSLMRSSRIASAVVIVLAVFLLGGLVDLGLNMGKAYPGVQVGEVDVSGKTAEEIVNALERTYGTRLSEGSATIYSSNEAIRTVPDGQGDELPSDQRTVEEERAATTSWTVEASTLSAQLPASELADQAIAVGREGGGLPARLAAAFHGRMVEVHARYADDQMESLAEDIDATIGEERVDYGIAVTDGVAQVSEGHNGYMVNRETLSRDLDDTFLSTVEGTGSFTVHAEYAPVRIDAGEARRACEDVNAAITDGVRFVYGDAVWDVSAKEVGTWVMGRIEEHDDDYTIVPAIDETKAKPDIILFEKDNEDGESPRVSFEVSPEGSVTVHTVGAEDVFLTIETVSALDATLFGPDGKAARMRAMEVDGGDGAMASTDPVEVSLVRGSLPESLAFDEALDIGLIEPVSSFTTEYTVGMGTENRNHNIALVSQLLDDSIVEPGGYWSFNETAGECNAERGFLGAGAIVDGVYDDAVGGGICQVATTVFNAVYEAGYPVKTRHSHSLYIPSYPIGRDAAVSWPDLDLVWENDGESAVLVRVACADSLVTATLYSVSPDYQVSTRVGDWQEGEKHETVTKEDETLEPGTSYVKTRGTDGRKISVVRTVRSRTGTLLHEDLFASEYEPMTEVVIEGPKEESEKAESTDSSDADTT